MARYLPWRRTVYSFSQKAGVRDVLLPVQLSLKLKLIVTNRRELDIAPHPCQAKFGVMQSGLRGPATEACSGHRQQLGPSGSVPDLPAERAQRIAQAVGLAPVAF